MVGWCSSNDHYVVGDVRWCLEEHERGVELVWDGRTNVCASSRDTQELHVQ